MSVSDRYRTALCPYLSIGNRRLLIHLDAYGVPQSLQWPRPGSVDRLGWRDAIDEWPYWEELTEEAVRFHMPYFEYAVGTRDYLHDAVEMDVDYVEDTNVLQGCYELPGGAVVRMTSFVLHDADVWVRHFTVTGEGAFVHHSEFFEKAVRGHPCAQDGIAGFRGMFPASPQGVYLLASDNPMFQDRGRFAVPVSGTHEWTILFSVADDNHSVQQLSEQTIRRGYRELKDEAIAADRRWIANARTPVNQHPFVTKHYKRWLLANMLCVTEDGAALAGPRPFWSFSWPRDSSIIAAGFAVAGFSDLAKSIVAWHLDNTPPSGIHDARYYTDRRPVAFDHRPRQGDNPGFLAWASSFVCLQAWDTDFVNHIKDPLFTLADALAHHRDDNGLMKPESDYWEGTLSQSICISTTATGGLLGAAKIAERLGLTDRAEAYRQRAAELKDATRELLWSEDNKSFMRSINPTDHDCDVSVCWGLHPTGVWPKDDPHMIQSLDRIRRELWNHDNGALLVGKDTVFESFWHFHTGFYLLGCAAICDTQTTNQILDSLDRNSSPQGLIPEQVSSKSGRLWGCNYLATSQALLLLYAYMNG